MLWKCPRCKMEHEVIVFNDHEGIAGFMFEEHGILVLYYLNKSFYNNNIEFLINAYAETYLYCHECQKKADGRKKEVKRIHYTLWYLIRNGVYFYDDMRG